MSTYYENVLRSVEALSEDEQIQLVSQVSERLRVHTATGTPPSILDLQGVGKEIWGELDAQEYVDRERASWNG